MLLALKAQHAVARKEDIAVLAVVLMAGAAGQGKGSHSNSSSRGLGPESVLQLPKGGAGGRQRVALCPCC